MKKNESIGMCKTECGADATMKCPGCGLPVCGVHAVFQVLGTAERLCWQCGSNFVALNWKGNLAGPNGREALRLPHLQKQFAAVMRAGNADADPDEINWERVIELWDVGPAAQGRLF